MCIFVAFSHNDTKHFSKIRAKNGQDPYFYHPQSGKARQNCTGKTLLLLLLSTETIPWTTTILVLFERGEIWLPDGHSFTLLYQQIRA